MYQDFIIKQTKDVFNNPYKSNVLVGNWYQQRCDPADTSATFYHENKHSLPFHRAVLHEENFQNSSQNFMNFQKYQPEKQFVSEAMDNYREPQKQERLSKMIPTAVTMSQFAKQPEKLKAYRQKWTKSPHIYDKSRTYLGSQKQ